MALVLSNPKGFAWPSWKDLGRRLFPKKSVLGPAAPQQAAGHSPGEGYHLLHHDDERLGGVGLATLGAWRFGGLEMFGLQWFFLKVFFLHFFLFVSNVFSTVTKKEVVYLVLNFEGL